MQVSRSPTARWTSAAATAESTPPESAQMTLPSDPTSRACASTRSRISATGDSMKVAGVHVARAPAIPTTKLRRTSRPRGVWATWGWNWIPYRFRASSTRPAKGVEPEWAVEWNPSGRRVIESPWLIQTGCSRPRPPTRRAARGVRPLARAGDERGELAPEVEDDDGPVVRGRRAVAWAPLRTRGVEGGLEVCLDLGV